jgi:hypothetical protein
MPIRLLIFFSLVAATVIFLTGAWTGSLVPPAEHTEANFLPQSVPLDTEIVGAGISAAELLDKAVARLAAAPSPWLKTKVRQTMSRFGSTFVADGFLQRGPNHCARLEMTVAGNGQGGHLLVVSDGVLLARVCAVPGEKRAPSAEPLPAAGDLAARDEFLTARSCGGPLAVVRQLHAHLRNGKLQTGRLDDRAVIQVKGEIDSDAKCSPGFSISAHQACAYLDAKTLWPWRVEWHGRAKAGEPRQMLCVEFHDPEMDRELSAAECTRLFSYQPED